MKRHLTRRQLFGWLLGGVFVVTAAFAVPVITVVRLFERPRSKGLPPIPTRPFDEAELRRPHDLAG